MTFERVQHSVAPASPTRATSFAASAAASAVSLLLLASPSPSHAQTMPSASSSTRTAPAAGTQASAFSAPTAAQREAADDKAIRTFHVDIPEADLVDLRRRIAATRWPERETVADQSQGVQLATLQALVRYWGTDYDWRKAEAKLNALPQFLTNIASTFISFTCTRVMQACCR